MRSRTDGRDGSGPLPVARPGSTMGRPAPVVQTISPRHEPPVTPLFPVFMSLFVILIAAGMQRPLRRLRELGATSPETARPVADFSAREQRALRTWMARGVVHETSPGMVWYDAEANARHQARGAKVAGTLAIVLLLVAVGLFLYTRSR